MSRTKVRRTKLCTMQIVDIDDKKGIVHIKLGEALAFEGETRLRDAADQMQRTFEAVVVFGEKLRLHAKPKPSGFSKPLLRRQAGKFMDRVEAVLKELSDEQIDVCLKRARLQDAVPQPSYVGAAGNEREPDLL